MVDRIEILEQEISDLIDENKNLRTCLRLQLDQWSAVRQFFPHIIVSPQGIDEAKRLIDYDE